MKTAWKHFKNTNAWAPLLESNLTGPGKGVCFTLKVTYSNEQSELRTTAFYISFPSLLPIFTELSLYQLF